MARLAGLDGISEFLGCRNRRLAIMHSQVHADDGSLLATATGSHTIFSRRK